jgi:hypothetical protein
MSRSSGSPAPQSAVTKPAPSGPRESNRRPEPPGPWRDPIPMKPRPRLFVALLIVFAVWVGVLVMMYFTTVRAHHQRRRPPAPQPRATAAVLETPAAKSLSSWMW